MVILLDATIRQTRNLGLNFCENYSVGFPPVRFSLMAELRRSSSLTPAKEVIARLDACPENAGHSCTWWVTCSSFPSQRFAFNGLTALSVCLSSLFLFGPFVVLMLYCFGFRPC